MLTVIDVETTSTVMPWGRDPSPYNSANYLVSIGWWNERDDLVYYNAGNRHAPIATGLTNVIQEMLDNTTLLVAHNLKFDLSWLFELGYRYAGELHCTMVGDYLLARGRPVVLDLTSCCVRHGVEGKDDKEVKELWNKGIGFEEMPWPLVETYGRQDILSCRDLYFAQQKVLYT